MTISKRQSQCKVGKHHDSLFSVFYCLYSILSEKNEKIKGHANKLKLLTCFIRIKIMSQVA